MKNVAGMFSEAMKQDESLLESIASKQANFISQLEVENKNIEKISVKTSIWSSLRTLFAVALSLVIFVNMMVVIHFFPSTTYISLNKS